MSVRPLAFAAAVTLAAGFTASSAVHAQAYGAPINQEQARRIYAGADAEARKNNWAMTVVILDSGCNPILMQRADGAQLASPTVAHDKAMTACLYKRSTKVLQEQLAKGGDGWRYLTFPRMIAAEGGIPIILDGRIIGAIGVSGAAGPDDARVAQAGIDALK